MRRGFEELGRLKIEISASRRAQQLAAIEEELRAAPRPTTGRAWSRRAAVAAVTLAVLLPTVAIASEGSIPGDLLYPVKRAIEPLRLLFDGEVEARHRVDELESLVESKATTDIVDRQIERARDALAEVDAPDLQRRFDGVVDRITDASTERAPSPNQPSGETDGPITTIAESDTPTTTHDPGEADPVRDETTTTTTTPPGDRERPPPSDRPPGDG